MSLAFTQQDCLVFQIACNCLLDSSFFSFGEDPENNFAVSRTVDLQTIR